ncbi:MAG: folylpolyglutamate synthase/dihydrofolate synthase family protein [Prolixibacteraceae bacterium]
MTYEQTLEYLLGQLPMYQRSGVAAYKDNLDNTLALDCLFDHPHRNFKTIHVAGTNGKGSVSHMLASILQSAGYKVGLYTSPHLKDYRERIRLNGEMISQVAVCNFIERFRSLNVNEKIEPSFFELSVAMAFDYFSNEKVDVAVIEVGLGGRLDSTNIITPEVSVITNISLDHTFLLGNTLELIAGEKAGIIKAGIPVVIGETQKKTTAVFQQKSKDLNAPLIFADQNYFLNLASDGTFTISSKDKDLFSRIELGLKGEYQQKNVLTTIATIQLLKTRGFQLEKRAISDGLKNVALYTGLEGRWQLLGDHPNIICDTGHNEAGIRWVMSQLSKEKFEHLHIVFGTVNDKDVSTILSLLPESATYYFAQAGIERAMDAEQLKTLAVSYHLNGDVYASVQAAFDAAKKNAGYNDFIFVGGSTFVVAEVI